MTARLVDLSCWFIQSYQPFTTTSTTKLSNKMPKCQVYGCPNQPGACDGKKRSFFMIPDGEKNPQLCSIWIKSLGPTKYHAETFRSNKCRTVCEEHFTPDCFQEDKYAKLLGYIPNRKLLKPGVYPTLVGEKAYASRLKRLHAKERKRKELEAKVNQVINYRCIVLEFQIWLDTSFAWFNLIIWDYRIFEIYYTIWKFL